MRKFSIIDPLYMAFYSRDIYRDVAANWSTGLCFVYLLSLIALCWVPGMIRMDTYISSFLDDKAPKYIAQMPDITISKGEASIRESQPYIIKDADTGEPFMIIDTTGSVKSLDDSKAAVLLVKDRLFIRMPDDKPQVMPLSDLGDGTITRAALKQLVDPLADWLAVLLYPFMVLIDFVFRSAQVLIIALFGTILTRSLNARLGYKELVRVTSVAVTPLLVFHSLRFFFGPEIPLLILLELALITGYEVFAIRANAAVSEPK